MKVRMIIHKALFKYHDIGFHSFEFHNNEVVSSTIIRFARSNCRRKHSYAFLLAVSVYIQLELRVHKKSHQCIITLQNPHSLQLNSIHLSEPLK